MDSLLDDTIAYVSNAEGVVLWISHEEVFTKVGDYLWDHACPNDKPGFRTLFSRVVTSAAPQTGEGFNKAGAMFRGWGWSLNGAEHAVCALFIKIPNSIALLSDKERDLMGGLASGNSVKQLAEGSGISISTVHTRMRRIREKLDLKTQEALIGFAGRYLSRQEFFDSSREPIPFESLPNAPVTVPESLFALKGTHAMLCDWQGTVKWQSQSGTMVSVGEPIWKYADKAYLDRCRDAVARCVTLGEPQIGEAFNQRGEYYRCYSWPLKSPDFAMFALMIRVPEKLAELDEREREAVNLLAAGFRTKEIAEVMDLGTSTVSSLMRSAREKLEVETQEALIGFAGRYCVPHSLPFP